MIKKLHFLCIVLVIAGCAHSTDGDRAGNDAGQSAAASEKGGINSAVSDDAYINMAWGGFIIIDRKIAYKMDYALKQVSQKQQRIVIEFENPDPVGELIVLDVMTDVGEKELSVTSRALSGIRNDASYTVIASLYEGDKKLTSVTSQVYFNVAPAMLEKLGIRTFD